jgi:Rrf2 family iron-sulfur cluster assembly transcriptional regulator
MSVEPSQEAKYAILALAYLARQESARLVPIREIEDGVGVPGPFLAKILAKLSRTGLPSTRRGPQGGVRLSRRPREVSLGEVVRTLDGRRRKATCYLGLPYCSERNPCPIHAVWRREVDRLDRVMHERTLADLHRVRLSGRPKRRSRKE